MGSQARLERALQNRDVPKATRDNVIPILDHLGSYGDNLSDVVYGYTDDGDSSRHLIQSLFEVRDRLNKDIETLDILLKDQR